MQSVQNMAQTTETCSIIDMPNEILELIFSMTSQYRDFKHIKLVCRRWNIILAGVVTRHSQHFQRALQSDGLIWSYHQPTYDLTILGRYAHCACYYDCALYVFGGCTSTATTFNDLWIFDLINERWFRPLATGSYPSPKAWATMVAHKDSLVLFGGWSYPTPITFHQTSRFFDQLHLYNPAVNEWTQVASQNCPGGKAGHGASVIGNSMILFGGCHQFESSCNDILVLNLDDMIWKKQVTLEKRPRPRFSHSQVVIDDYHILILGGCGGANMQLCDAWLLTLSSSEGIWWWQELSILNPEFSAPQLWCHPACKVGNKMVILSKNPKAFRWATAQSVTDSAGSSSQRQQCQAHSCKHLDDNPVLQVVQRNAILCHGLSCDKSNADTLLNSSGSSQLKQINSPSLVTSVSAPYESSVSFSPAADSLDTLSSDTYLTGASSDPSSDANPYCVSKVRSSMPSIRPNAMKNRLHQLEILKKYEEKYRASTNSGDHKNIKLPKKRLSINPLCVHTIDLDNVLSEGSISWLPIQKPDCSICPEETIFYSLVEGRGEIILFGGICGDLHSMEIGLPSKMQTVNNSVFYLSFMKHIN